MQQQADIGGGAYQSKTHDARGTSKQYYNEQNLMQQHRLLEDEDPVEESEEQILGG
jgi:hypothetical protein